MADNTEKLEHFQKAVFNEINGEINAIVSSAEKESAQIIESAKDEYLNDSYIKVSTQTKKIKAECRKKVSKRSFEANRETIAYRTEIIDKFFETLSQRLAEFASSDKYLPFVKKSTDKTNSEKAFYEGVVAYVKKGDEEKVKSSVPSVVTIKTDKNIKLGGVIFFYPNENQFVDNTLDNAFLKEKESFVNNAALQL